jgi:hypothetical protein
MTTQMVRKQIRFVNPFANTFRLEDWIDLLVFIW